MFELYNAQAPVGPVVISVPHAGRSHPPGIEAALRLPLAGLRALEDRHADLLAADAIASGWPALVARTPRLWIDLNRAEDDIDPGMVSGGGTAFARLSPRARGGLGIIPRRLGMQGDIWRGRLSRDAVAARIATVHRPYHDALAAQLRAVLERFGAVVLLDLHSMPSLPGADAAQIVIGDRFGRSAAARFTACAESVFAQAGLRGAANTPYPGGHILDRHGDPARGVHALQIEIDRALYLDRAFDAPGSGLPIMQRLIANLATRLADEAVPPVALAAQ